jgi:hypothetical protein
MKITNRKLVESISLIHQVAQKQLPVKASYTISRNISHIESALRLYDTERQKLLDKYAEKDANGRFALRPDGISAKFKNNEAAENFQKNINTLLDIEADIDIRKFKLNDLGNISFSAAEIGAIDCMIEE